MNMIGSGFWGVAIGIGLSAACGFRVILPFFGLAIAGMNHWVELSPEFQWIATPPALIAFATAAALEIAAYYVPWMDNLLDTLTTPLAVLAGSAAMAAVVTDLPPLWKWSLSLIAGGGMAAVVQSGTVLMRGASTAAAAGAGNFAVATAELAGSLVTTFLALAVPVVAFAVACLVALWVIRKLLHRRGKPRPTGPAAGSPGGTAP